MFSSGGVWCGGEGPSGLRPAQRGENNGAQQAQGAAVGCGHPRGGVWGPPRRGGGGPLSPPRGARSTGGAVLALAGAGMAYASIPDSDGTFHACVSNSGGSIRMIDPSQAGSAGHCVDGETQVSWNKSGQKGAKGPKGATGATGPQGQQ